MRLLKQPFRNSADDTREPDHTCSWNHDLLLYESGSVRKLTDTMIMGLGLFAFIFDSIGGVMFAKFLNLFCKNKVNPMVGAAGISAFPMSARVIEKMGIAEDKTNHLLMHAIGANVSGQVASAVAGGIVLGFFM